jgi:hypothetical protein
VRFSSLIFWKTLSPEGHMPVDPASILDQKSENEPFFNFNVKHWHPVLFLFPASNSLPSGQ